MFYFSIFAIFLYHGLTDHYVERVTIAIIACWIVMEYLSQRWPRIWSVCRGHNLVLFYFHDQIFTSRAGTIKISGHLSAHSVWSGDRVTQALGFWEVCCPPLLICFVSLVHYIFCLRFTTYDYPFGIFKHFTIWLTSDTMTTPFEKMERAEKTKRGIKASMFVVQNILDKMHMRQEIFKYGQFYL